MFYRFMKNRGLYKKLYQYEGVTNMGLRRSSRQRWFRGEVPHFYLFVCSFFILLSRESDGCAIFWTNPYPLRSCLFFEFSCCFFDFLPLNLLLAEFAACSKPPSRDNHCKAPYPRTQQRVR